MGESTNIQWTDVLKERFWSYVDRRGQEECWPWIAGKFTNGYGQFRAGKRKVKAHRCAYELTNGHIEDGLRVLHRCDNPPCCNPQHLFKGTDLDNVRDCVLKGRHRSIPPPGRPGAANPSAKVTTDIVFNIRQQAQSGASQRSLAVKHGLSQSQVGNIVRGQCWQDGPWP